MDELFDLRPSGVFLRREAIAHGYSDRHLAAARRAHVIHRVRHGAYVESSTWSGATGLEQHRLRCCAVRLSHVAPIVFSHVSAAAMLGCDLWGTDLDRVHVIKNPAHTGRTNGDVVYHEDTVGRTTVVEPDGLEIVEPGHAVLGAAASTSVEAGVVIVDSAYRNGLVTPAELRATHDRMRGWPGTARLQITLRLSQPGSGSVGESRARYLFWRCHLPKPQLQYEVRNHEGRLIGISDFAWPALGLLGEFDGRIKYGRLLRPGEDPGDAVYAEKMREDQMREATGWRFFRMCWEDLSHPRRTADRFVRLAS